jgi:mRNA interferase MazF
LKQGNIIWLDFDPTIGSEQAGKRPAVVISNSAFASMTNQTLVIPITNTNRKCPLHVELKDVPGFSGFIMCDQIRTVDLRTRRYNMAGESVTAETLDLIVEVIKAALDSDA